MVEITDRKSLEAWLKTRPREDAVLIAARGVLRVLPLIVRELDDNAEKRRRTIVLPVFRASVVASFAGTWPKRASEVRAAAHAAALAADSAAAPSAAVYAAYAADGRDVHDTAYAAARAVGAAAHFAAWEAVTVDATALEEGLSHDALGATPIWPDVPFSGGVTFSDGVMFTLRPEWAAQWWNDLKDHLLNVGDGWEVWIDWYEDRLHGRPADEELEFKKALIPNEIWEAGPATLNAEIARIIAEHDAGRTVTSDSDRQDAEAALDATRTTADTDFVHDAVRNQMLPAPFPEDAAPVDDPYRMRERADLLSTLADMAVGLHADFKADKPQVPAALRRDLHRYAQEARKQPEDVRPRRLETLARKFEGALADDETRNGMDNYEISGLEGLLSEHRALIAGYYGALAERTRYIESYSLPAGTKPEEVEEKVTEAVGMLQGPNWAVMPAPPTDYPEHLSEQIAALREQRIRLDFQTVEDIRRRGAQQLHQETLIVVSNTVRLLARSVEAAVKHPITRGAATIGSALGLVRELLRLIGPS